MPSGAWDHVFPATKQLPELQALIVEPVVTQVVGQATKTRGRPDLACVVRCCPGLQQLSVQHDIRFHDSVPLQSLTALTNLWDLRMGGVDDADAAVLPQLTSLRHLKVGGMSEPGLLRLSVLQQLTSLSSSITYRGRERGVSGRGSCHSTSPFRHATCMLTVGCQMLHVSVPVCSM